jgi:hypothetical protein
LGDLNIPFQELTSWLFKFLGNGLWFVNPSKGSLYWVQYRAILQRSNRIRPA